MSRPKHRKAVKEFNLFLMGGIRTEAQPVYGEGSRGNVDHVGDRAELGGDHIDVDSKTEKKIKTLHYNFSKREYWEEPGS